MSMGWVVFLDWAARIGSLLFFGVMALSLLYMTLENLIALRKTTLSWHQFRTVCTMGFYLSMFVVLAWLTYMAPQSRTNFRLKREGVIVPCPTCGHDYNPDKVHR